MSCYNGSRWLESAINSVLYQTLLDFEFIIVDDGSTDNSLDIIKHYAGRDPRIIVLAKSNTGLTDSLNRGIEIARGEWIARLDADDICEPTRLEIQLSVARNKPDVVFIGSDLIIIDENGNKLKYYHYPVSHKSLLRNLRSSRKFPPHSSAFFRADVVRSIGGYRPRIKMSQDEDLWLRLSEVGQLASVNEKLVRIRQHGDQISHDKSGRRQRIYSNVALTSYWLRNYGMDDPVSADGKIFEEFSNYIKEIMDEEQLHDYMDYISGVKFCLENIRWHPTDIISAAEYIFSRPLFVFKYMHISIFGKKIAQKAARDWAKRRLDQ